MSYKLVHGDAIEEMAQVAADRFQERVALTLYEAVQSVTGVIYITNDNRERFDRVYRMAHVELVNREIPNEQ